MRYAYWLLVVMNFNVVSCNGWSDVEELAWLISLMREGLCAGSMVLLQSQHLHFCGEICCCFHSIVLVHEAQSSGTPSTNFWCSMQPVPVATARDGFLASDLFFLVSESIFAFFFTGFLVLEPLEEAVLLTLMCHSFWWCQMKYPCVVQAHPDLCTR